MTTNLALDDTLIIQVQKIGGFKTKRAAVNAALKDYVNRMNQIKLIEKFGKINFSKEYNYKRLRKRT